MKKQLKNKNGITLIALVVTIVVLLILAAVSISMLTGENGIITQAQNSKEQNEIGKEKEYINLAFSAVKAGKIARGDMSGVTSVELQEEINNYTTGATVTGTGILKITYTSGREYEVDGNGKIVSSESYDGMYSVGDLEGKIAPQDLFEYEIIDEQAKTARIVRIKPEYCNLEGYNPHTETYDFTNTNGDIVYNGEKISDMLVIPYEMEQNGIKYTITEANIMAENVEYIGSGEWAMYASYPNVDNLIYPNSIIVIQTAINPYDSSNDYGEYNAESVKSIVLSDNLKIIPENAFYNAIYLTNITLPDSVTYIGNEAFYNCSNLASITLPDSVTYIGNGAFYNCSNFASITIPDTVTRVGSSAFGGTLWYENQPDGDVYIGKVYYEYKGTMPANTIITIKEGTIGIAASAFSGCSNLTSITIPNSVTSIGGGAFSGCRSLTSITIPDNVTSIGAYAFDYCSSLTSITIPNSVTSIGDGAFSGCSSLTSITIPDNVTSIGYCAFYGCSSLTSITIPNSVTSIGASAFSRCTSLTNITIPNSVTSIGDYAFSNCENLTSITIPNSVTSIGYSAFKGCSSLTSITIPDSVTSIGEYAFYDCTNLTSINIKKEENSIPDARWGASNATINWNYTGE